MATIRIAVSALIISALASNIACAEEESGIEALYKESDKRIAMQKFLRAQREESERVLKELSKIAGKPVIEQRYIVKKSDREFVVRLSWIDTKSFASKSLTYLVVSDEDLLKSDYKTGGELIEGAQARQREGGQTGENEGFFFDGKKALWNEAKIPNLLAATRFNFKNLMFNLNTRIKLEMVKMQKELMNAENNSDAQRNLASEFEFLQKASGEVVLSPTPDVGDPSEYIYKVGEGGYIESLEIFRNGLPVERLTNRFVESIDFEIDQSKIGARLSKNLQNGALKTILLLGFRTAKVDGMDVVTHVMSKTPAKSLGLEMGDTIVSIKELNGFTEPMMERDPSKGYMFKVVARSTSGKMKELEMRPISYPVYRPNDEESWNKTLDGLH